MSTFIFYGIFYGIYSQLKILIINYYILNPIIRVPQSAPFYGCFQPL